MAITQLHTACIKDGTIVNADIDSSAAIALGKLGTSGTAGSGNFLRGDGAWTAIDLTALNASNLTSGTVAAARLDTATTQSAGNNSTKIATTAYTDTAISNLVDSSPSALNTLNELAAALGDDANFSTTVTNSIATKLPLAGGTLTGNVIHNDGIKALFGTSSDLQIYYNGTQNIIGDTTTQLRLITDAIRLRSKTNSHTYLEADQGAGVKINHNNSTTFETISGGATVTGKLNITAELNLINGSSNAARYIDCGLGDNNALTIRGTSGGDANHETLAKFIRNAACELYYDTDKRFQTEATGCAILQGSGAYGLNISGSEAGKIKLSGANDPYIRFQEGSTDKAFIQWNSTGYLQLTNQEDNASLRIKDDFQFSTDSSTYHTVWHAGNDGGGSGLDADLLDGFPSTQSGGANKVLVTNSSGYLILGDWLNVGNQQGIYCNHGQHFYAGGASTWMSWRNRSTNANACGIGLETSQGTVRGWVYADASYIGLLNSGGSWVIRAPIGDQNAPQTGGGHTLWHAGNDGSGSGLDADTLDGLQASQFIRADQDHTMVGDLTITNADPKLLIKDNNNTGNSSQNSLQGVASDGSQDWIIGNYTTSESTLFIKNNRNASTKFTATVSGDTWEIYGNSGHFAPCSDNAVDLGTSSKRIRNIYTADLNLSNKGSSNDVDGTWGQYTIQEGEDDLFLLNRRNGKKYKFNLTEVS